MPPDTPSFTYRAFLSYSHADKEQATAWRLRLESMIIPDHLHGDLTPAGPIPAHLRPIFQDETDFGLGEELTRATRDTLDDSAALILIASPNARASHYVNEEVRYFRHRHPDHPDPVRPARYGVP